MSVATDSNGTLVSRQFFDPWGQVRGEGISQTTLNYTGQHRDDTGLLFYNARYYDPATGRFISADTIVPSAPALTVAPNDAVAQGLWGKQGAAANPQELNRYSYVNNNPINATDPTGHFLDTILDVAFIAYGIYDIAANGYTAEKGLALAADVGGALIPGLTGAGAMVRAAAHADDIIDAGKATVNAVDAAGDAAKSFADGPRMRHYTSRNGAKAIQAEDTIKASNRQWESGCVFCEKANKKPMSQTDAEQYYGLGQGKGRDYVEFNTAPGEARSVKNPVTGRTEWVIDGDVSLAGRNSNIVKRP